MNRPGLIVLLFLAGIIFCRIPAEAQTTVRVNSLVLESNLIASTSLTYYRMIPVKEKMAVLVGAGFILGTGFGSGSQGAQIEANLGWFGHKHFLETGAEIVFGFEEDISPGLKLAYRYQGERGFTIRVAVNILANIDPPVLPTVGIGYAF